MFICTSKVKPPKEIAICRLPKPILWTQGLVKCPCKASLPDPTIHQRRAEPNLSTNNNQNICGVCVFFNRSCERGLGLGEGPEVGERCAAAKRVSDGETVLI